MTIVNRDVKRYLREVNSWLPCRRKLKTKIVAEITSNVSLFVTENSNSGYNEIVARFGTPQQIASTYVDEMETTELLNDLRIKRKIVSTVIAGVFVLIVTWSVAMGMIYFEGHKNINGNLNYDGIEVTYEETYPD